MATNFMEDKIRNGTVVLVTWFGAAYQSSRGDVGGASEERGVGDGIDRPPALALDPRLHRGGL